MSAHHTPGPWAFVTPDGMVVRHPQVYSDTGPVCNATWLGDSKLGELTANARLMAAAPEMLAALRRLFKACGHMPIEATPESAEMMMAGLDAVRAIKKATGEDP